MIDTSRETSGRHGPWSVTARLLVGREATTWDARAARLNGSIRSSTGRQRLRVVRRFPHLVLRRFELVTGDGRPAGLCAVAVGRHGGQFIDRLLLEPTAETSWGLAMAAVLDELPPGRYVYGWEENLEPPREEELSALPGVSVVAVHPLVVHSVEFSEWPSWEAYHHAVSTNVRRNAKRATVRLPDLQVDTHSGRSSWSQLVSLVRLRAETYRRKGLAFSPWRSLPGTLATVLADAEHGFVTVARDGGRPIAAFRGVWFGGTTSYLDGGSSARTHGASWLMLMTAMESAYRRDPGGRLVMGYLDRSLHDEAVGGGLLRQRRSCRAREVDTSIVTFDWAGRPTS